MLHKQYSNRVRYEYIRVHALQYNMAALAYGKQNYNFVRQEFVTANTVYNLTTDKDSKMIFYAFGRFKLG